MQQQQQQQIHIGDFAVPGLVKNKKKSIVIKSLADLLTQKDGDEIMEDLFSISDSSLSSDEEQEEEEKEEEEEENRFNIQAATIAQYEQQQHQQQDKTHMLLLPHLADYLVKHPDEPPENFLFRHYHRLSLQDLYYPIEEIGHIIQSCNSLAEGVYITADEFEALQGFSRFSTIN